MQAGVSLRARDLCKYFDHGLVRALQGVNLEVEASERLAITGPTGCGKSTLLSLLALLDEPDAGEIFVDGLPAARLRSPEDWRAERVGLVFQLHHLLPHLTVEENLLLPLQGRARQGRTRVEELASRLGLSHRLGARAAALSGGERQVAAVARALVRQPGLVLADEPTGAVDSATGERIVSTLLGWCEESGATMVLVTHDPGLADRLGRTVHMLDGRIV